VQTSYGLSQEGRNDWQTDYSYGRMANSICSPDVQANARQGNGWCRDFMQLVEGSADFDPSARERWRDAYYHQVCDRYLTEPGRTELAWCAPYARLLPTSSDYIGNAGRAAWLEDGKRYL